jgi:hypothetical protein
MSNRRLGALLTRVFLLLTIPALLLLAGSAPAAPVLDIAQEEVDNSFAMGEFDDAPGVIESLGQSFKPTKTGKLTQIDVHLGFQA